MSMGVELSMLKALRYNDSHRARNFYFKHQGANGLAYNGLHDDI